MPPFLVVHHTSSQPPLTLTCIFNGSHGILDWYKDGNLITNSGYTVETHLVNEDESIYISHLIFSDREGEEMRGEYYCQFNSQLVTGGNNEEEATHYNYKGMDIAVY